VPPFDAPGVMGVGWMLVCGELLDDCASVVEGCEANGFDVNV